MKSFGFGPTFQNIIQMLYKDIHSLVSLCSGLSEGFPVKPRIHQGCPINPLLFILATELFYLFKNKSI